MSIKIKMTLKNSKNIKDTQKYKGHSLKKRLFPLSANS